MINRKIIISSLLCISSQSIAMKLSNNGLNHIKEIEKCSLTRYWDNGAYSIGYGHRMLSGTKQYKTISKAFAIKLLKEDLKDAESSANRIIKELKWKPSQEFFDGLVSLIYNCGEGGLKKSTFYKRLKACRVSLGKVNKSDFDFTLAAVKSTRIPVDPYAKGVKERRKIEYKLMCTSI